MANSDSNVTIEIISAVSGLLGTLIVTRYGPFIRKRTTQKLPKEIQDATGLEKMQSILRASIENDDKVIKNLRERLEASDEENNKLRDAKEKLEEINQQREEAIERLQKQINQKSVDTPINRPPIS